MTWKQLLRDLEALEAGLENSPLDRDSANVRHYARIRLANALAEAREILEALANDEREP